jgi:hypothetical protein
MILSLNYNNIIIMNTQCVGSYTSKQPMLLLLFVMSRVSLSDQLHPLLLHTTAYSQYRSRVFSTLILMIIAEIYDYCWGEVKCFAIASYRYSDFSPRQ